MKAGGAIVLAPVAVIETGAITRVDVSAVVVVIGIATVLGVIAERGLRGLCVSGAGAEKGTEVHLPVTVTEVGARNEEEREMTNTRAEARCGKIIPKYF